MSKVQVLAHADRGVGRYIWDLVPGDFIWHKGAYRQVTKIEDRVVRMGRFSVRPGYFKMETATHF